MNKKLVSVIIAAVVALTSWSCSKGDHPRKVETITIGVPPLEQNALLYAAESQREIPDFVNYVHTDALKTLKPEAVNIIK